MDHTQPLNVLRGLRGHPPPDAVTNGHRPAASAPGASAPGPAPPAWSSAASPGLLHQNDPGPLAIAWRDRWMLLVIAAVIGGVVFVLSAQMPAVYAAETTLAFPYTSSEVALPGGDAERSRTLRTEAERITSFGLLEQAAKAMATRIEVASLRERVAAIPASNADVITVRATAPTASEAVTIADAVAAAYRRQVDWRQQNSIEDLERRAKTLEKRISTQQEQLAGQLQDSAVGTDDQQAANSDPAVSALRIALEASVSQLSDVQQGLDEVRAQQETASGGVQVLQPAGMPAVPEQPRPARNAATAVILALMAVTTVRWWRADPEPPCVQDAQTAEALLGFPVIAEVGYLRRPTGPAGTVTGAYPEIIDAYRMVAAATPVHGSVLVTAARPDESCSDLVLNTGAVLSRDGYRVLLVEGEPHARRLVGREADNHPGLTDLVNGRSDLGACLMSGRISDHAHVGLVPWGIGAAGFPRSVRSQVGVAIAQCTVNADVVMIDGPPLASSADGLALAGHVDGILLVVSTGTAVSDVRRLRTRLDQLDRPVLGIVVQHTSTRHRSRRRHRSSTVPVRWTRARQRSATDPTRADA